MPSGRRSSVAQFSVSASQLIKLIKSVTSLVLKKKSHYYSMRRLKSDFRYEYLGGFGWWDLALSLTDASFWTLMSNASTKMMTILLPPTPPRHSYPLGYFLHLYCSWCLCTDYLNNIQTNERIRNKVKN